MIILDVLLNCLGWFFILAGAFFVLTGSLGILRMPDFFSRLHPAGITDALGAPFILLGVIVLHGFTLFSGKIVLLLLFLLITGPTSTHALAKCALVFDSEKKVRGRRRVGT